MVFQLLVLLLCFLSNQLYSLIQQIGYMVQYLSCHSALNAAMRYIFTCSIQGHSMSISSHCLPSCDAEVPGNTFCSSTVFDYPTSVQSFGFFSPVVSLYCLVMKYRLALQIQLCLVPSYRFTDFGICVKGVFMHKL